MDVPSIDWSIAGFADAVTILAGLGTLIALFYAGKQLKHSQRVSSGDLLLHIDELLIQYNEVHRQLVTSQFLFRNPQLPQPADQAESLVTTFQKNSYMGLLERVNVLVDTGLLDIATVYHLYGHRVQILAQDPEVSEWLEEQPSDWYHFIALNKALEKYRHDLSVQGRQK